MRFGATAVCGWDLLGGPQPGWVAHSLNWKMSKLVTARIWTASFGFVSYTRVPFWVPILDPVPFDVWLCVETSNHSREGRVRGGPEMYWRGGVACD